MSLKPRIGTALALAAGVAVLASAQSAPLQVHFRWPRRCQQVEAGRRDGLTVDKDGASG